MYMYIYIGVYIHIPVYILYSIYIIYQVYQYFKLLNLLLYLMLKVKPSIFPLLIVTSLLFRIL
jgi:hypothetical protein